MCKVIDDTEARLRHFAFYGILKKYMTRKKNDTIKPLQKTEASVTEILIAGNESLKPYIQTFHYEPENIALASLGSVLGIFEIEDQHEDSAYIVNFLASVVKKEYFMHPKRAAIESLEATLHKINRALSELIKQDNTAWLGKLNATICVLEKNSIHFSVSGKAKTILIRNSVLNDISDGLAEESELHPLKTFTEVSSGRVNIGDKILLTTPGLFEIFSPEELQKNAERFSNEKFSQFLKTALVNQLLFGSTVIIDIFEASVQKPILKKSKEVEETKEIPNVFSQSAFSNKKTASEPGKIDSEPQLKDSDEPISQEIEYTDSKTGHIYVQGDTPEIQPNETWIRIQEISEEILVQCVHVGKKTGRICLRTTRDIISKTKSIKLPSRPQERNHETIPTDKRIEIVSENTSSVGITISDTIKRAVPRFSVIKEEFSKLSTNQKRFALGAIFAIFVIPFLIVQFQEEPRSSSTLIEEKSPVIAPDPLSKDKNKRTVTTGQSILSNNALLTTVILKGTPFAITRNSVINLENPQDTQAFPLPSTFDATIMQATAMKDLNTIFLLTDTGKIISFTPSNRAFTENNISLPEAGDIADIETYLTYLYVLDNKNRTIYRYPRADGGFGAQSVWLKETIDTNKTDTIAINENLYLSQTNSMTAFNKGKRDMVAFEQSATPIIFSNLFAQPETQFIYALDSVNGRLVQFEKSGTIVSQYAYEKIKGSTSVAVDEQKKKAYFTTPSEVFSIGL